jgi:hypothetical protein
MFGISQLEMLIFLVIVIYLVWRLKDFNRK